MVYPAEANRIVNATTNSAGDSTRCDPSSDILRLVGALETLNGELGALARTSALAEARYKSEFAKSMLAARGKTVGEREAVAQLETGSLYEARKVAEAMLEVSRESGRNIRAQLDALRSVSASQRNSW